MLKFFLTKVKDLGKSKYISCTCSLYIHIHKPQNLTELDKKILKLIFLQK